MRKKIIKLSDLRGDWNVNKILDNKSLEDPHVGKIYTKNNKKLKVKRYYGNKLYQVELDGKLQLISEKELKQFF